MKRKIFENSPTAKAIANYHLPRYKELPDYDMFMNQLVNTLNELLAVFLAPGEEKTLTSSMINNYVFNHIIPSPNQKKYNKVHLAYLIVIGILKQVLAINDISMILKLQAKQYKINTAYDYFCIEVEKALSVVFDERDFSDIDKTQPKKITPLTKQTRSAVLSFANKIYVKQSIYFDN